MRRISFGETQDEEIRECLIGPNAAEAVKFGTMEPQYDRFFILTLAQNKETLLNFTALRYCDR